MIETIIAVGYSFLLETAAHYFPLKAKNKVANYVIGTAAMLTPALVVLVMWQSWNELILIASSVVVSGLSVGLWNLVDHYRHLKTTRHEAVERAVLAEEIAREVIK